MKSTAQGDPLNFVPCRLCPEPALVNDSTFGFENDDLCAGCARRVESDMRTRKEPVDDR